MNGPRRSTFIICNTTLLQVKRSIAVLLGMAFLVLSPITTATAEQPPRTNMPEVIDKTLVAWISPGNLTQRGGSVLTLDDQQGHFDGIVFGELLPAKWMAGSDFYNRTKKDQANDPAEIADPKTLLQIAIVYQGTQITVYRNGKEYSRHQISQSQKFGSDSAVVIGLRHLEADSQPYFIGTVDDARIYNLPLSAEQITALVPHQLSDPKPLAWWSFTDGKLTDRMNTFPFTTLIGDARIGNGKLQVDKNAYLIASRAAPENGSAPIRFGNLNASTRAIREKLLSDPYRAGYHFVIPEGCAMPFDPNGAIYWKGRYHLFYIFQDQRGHNWGHVSSTDLFHWRHHPAGLVAGMFSGNCFINKEGRPTMCYHQVDQGNAMAVAVDDELNEWKKLDSNPITPKTKPGDPFHDRYRSWDPYGWLEGDNYYAIFGGQRPAIAKAPKLEGEWKYVGDLMANTVPGVSINEDVSCADFFKLGDKQMLLCISHRLGARYYLGEWKDEQFHPTFHEKLSWVDNSFFAPESLLDDKGRRIMWAWILDGPEFKSRTNDGWSGTMSLPRVLSLGADGMLRMNPPMEIEQLRYNQKKKTDILVKADSELILDGIAGKSIELDLEMNSKQAKQFGVKVCLAPRGEEQTLIYYDATEKKIKVDTNKSSLTEGPKSIEAGPFELQPEESLKLRIFIDKSVVEVFANGRQAVMRRIYPSRPDSVGVAIFSNGASTMVPLVEAWDMMPSNSY